MRIYITSNLPDISKRDFDTFIYRFKQGIFGRQRLGQAFYNEFNLRSVHDQNALYNLYDKDEDEALELIKALFNLRF